ncbi:MAG: aminoglycoside phosphotransferase family protein [Kiritimatiellae bacterium]|nr:aminoglycoside phosphotransferase family protein [Kiritimatiellia bacterium]
MTTSGAFSYSPSPMLHDKKTLQAVGEQFQISGTWVDAVPYGNGHINDTYLVQWQVNGKPANTIQQRINHVVFKNPPHLMDNIIRVTGHLQGKLNGTPGHNANRETLIVIPTRSNHSYFQDADGNYWRMYVFVQDAITVDVCSNPVQAFEASKAFGNFQAQLADLPGGRLHDTIPYFHHTPRRFQTLEDAIQKDSCNRCAAARKEIDFCLAHRPMASIITNLIENGHMPERITHNDTKINNVMIDNRTGQGVCVIDLDTVMTGCALYDFGDMVRTMPATSEEDERDLNKVTLDIGLFEALTRGYLEGARSFLSSIETEHLVVAGRVITLTIGIRFLTDYLLGDVYFKIHRPDHNLDRARVQFKMIESMEQSETAMNAVVQKYT